MNTTYTAICPGCSAPVDFPEGSDRVYCKFCGNQVLLQTGGSASHSTPRKTPEPQRTNFSIFRGVVRAYYGESTKVIIPEGVTAIAEKAFEKSNIEEVHFPSTLKSIGKNAFSHCENLTTVVFPPSLTEIGDFAFSGTGLKEVEIPETLTRIGDLAFVGCLQLTKIIFPDNL